MLQLSLNAQEIKTPEMSPLSYQIGKWLASDVQTDKDGNRLQFGYELQWFDQKQSIAKMTITRIYENGKVELLWEGFKNWDAQEGKIMYSGFSRIGRTAAGYLEVKNKNEIKTKSSGVSQNGKKVFIEDIATKIDDNHYTSITQIKMEGQEEWRKLNTDHWVKVEKQIFNDKLTQ